MIELLLRLALLILVFGAGLWVIDRLSTRWARRDMASDNPLVRAYAVQMGAVHAVARRIKLAVCMVVAFATGPIESLWVALAVIFPMVILADVVVHRLYVRPRRRAITGDA